jgi:hypothetical protein
LAPGGNLVAVDGNISTQNIELDLNQPVNATNQIAIMGAGTSLSNFKMGAVTNYTTGLPGVSNAYFI